MSLGVSGRSAASADTKPELTIWAQPVRRRSLPVTHGSFSVIAMATKRSSAWPEPDDPSAAEAVANSAACDRLGDDSLARLQTWRAAFGRVTRGPAWRIAGAP